MALNNVFFSDALQDLCKIKKNNLSMSKKYLRIWENEQRLRAFQVCRASLELIFYFMHAQAVHKSLT